MACSRCRRREDGAVEREVATGPRLGSRRFFKIVLSSALESGKLEIPKSFLRRCGKDLPNSVLLKVPDGSTWTIELEKHNNDLVLLWEGWRQFTEHYSIDHGHLIVFEYKGNSTFHVIIFDKSASEIDYSSCSGKTSYLGSVYPSPKTEDVLEAEDLEDFTRHHRMTVEPHLPYSQLSPIYSPRVSEGGVEQSTCRASRSEPDFHGPTLPRSLTSPILASNIDTEHPFFKLVIPRSYMCGLGVPTGFTKPHIQENRRIATLRYSDRSWLVKLVWSHGRPKQTPRMSFSAGWRAFARETHLRAGNVCMFELIDRDHTVFKVSILSGTDNDLIHID